jgi:adenylate cyclase
MSFEIERKFLVKWPLEQILLQHPPVRTLIVEQRYLQESGDWTVRVRKTVCEEASYYLTMKKRVTDRRTIELETPIDAVFYAKVAHQCGVPLMKTRYEIEYGERLWEIDVFQHKKLDGLILAEIELPHEHTVIEFPEWVGVEVTNDKFYKNAKMAKRIA